MLHRSRICWGLRQAAEQTEGPFGPLEENSPLPPATHMPPILYMSMSRSRSLRITLSRSPCR